MRLWPSYHTTSFPPTKPTREAIHLRVPASSVDVTPMSGRGEVVGVGVGGGEYTVDGAAPGRDAVVVGPQPGQLVGVLPAMESRPKCL
jgi:hypothetical protein